MVTRDEQELLERYLEQHSTPESAVLKELNRFTHLNTVHPQMLAGPLLGQLLRMISLMIRPENILEVGTFTGYSAICLAEGLVDRGKLITIDINDELHEISAKFIRKAGLENRIQLIIGDALEIIPTLDLSFQLVFIDGLKEQYSDYYHLVIEKVPPGGYILADNVLWGGKVLNENKYDPATGSLQKFNRMVTEDPRVENLMLPVRDGLMLIRKR